MKPFPENTVLYNLQYLFSAAKIEHDGPAYDTAYVDVGAELLLTCTYTGAEDPSKVQWLKVCYCSCVFKNLLTSSLNDWDPEKPVLSSNCIKNLVLGFFFFFFFL